MHSDVGDDDELAVGGKAVNALAEVDISPTSGRPRNGPRLTETLNPIRYSVLSLGPEWPSQ